MKPLGLTVDLQVVRANRAQDAIWNAVEEAQGIGMTVEQFRREAADAWSYGLKQRREADAKAWEPPQP